MNQPIYHETSAAIYFDNGDGSLSVKQKRKVKLTQTLAVFKNDDRGQLAYRRFRKALVNNGHRVYTMYRCPNDGRSYDQTTNHTRMSSRRGNIPKKFAMVLSVLRSYSDYHPQQ
jgi:hypothetical protein